MPLFCHMPAKPSLKHFENQQYSKSPACRKQPPQWFSAKPPRIRINCGCCRITQPTCFTTSVPNVLLETTMRVGQNIGHVMGIVKCKPITTDTWAINSLLAAKMHALPEKRGTWIFHWKTIGLYWWTQLHQVHCHSPPHFLQRVWWLPPIYHWVRLGNGAALYATKLSQWMLLVSHDHTLGKWVIMVCVISRHGAYNVSLRLYSYHPVSVDWFGGCCLWISSVFMKVFTCPGLALICVPVPLF